MARHDRTVLLDDIYPEKASGSGLGVDFARDNRIAAWRVDVLRTLREGTAEEKLERVDALRAAAGIKQPRGRAHWTDRAICQGSIGRLDRDSIVEIRPDCTEPLSKYLQPLEPELADYPGSSSGENYSLLLKGQND